ncbi:MAG: uroporphyrinogen decarboxylase [Alphaproteobacteria bacterium]|nr:uroporphyrinogen decarboxylase [Alphaproteobacteria bacterium]
MLEALAGRRSGRPPIWLMRQAGRYLPEYRKLRAQVGGFLDLCFTPDLAVEVTLQPIRRFAFDAAILFSDILVVPHALGQTVSFREGEGPVLRPIRTADDVNRLERDRLPETLAPVYETVRRLSVSLPDQVALIGFAGAPWTVATYMVEGGTSRDFHHTKLWAYRDPEGFAVLIDRVVDATIEYLRSQVESGAEIIQLFDSWAGVLPEVEFDRWVIAPTRRIVAALRASHPDLPVIGFPRGAGALYPRYFAQTGVTAVSLDTGVPCSWARTALQQLGPVQGNLDPLALVAGGTALANATAAILEAFAAGPFIFNLGHGIVPETPPEHVAELVDRVRRG